MEKPKRTGDGQVVQEAIRGSGKDAGTGASADAGPLPMGVVVGSNGKTEGIGYPQTEKPVFGDPVSPTKETNVFSATPNWPRVTK